MQIRNQSGTVLCQFAARSCDECLFYTEVFVPVEGTDNTVDMQHDCCLGGTFATCPCVECTPEEMDKIGDFLREIRGVN